MPSVNVERLCHPRVYGLEVISEFPLTAAYPFTARSGHRRAVLVRFIQDQHKLPQPSPQGRAGKSMLAAKFHDRGHQIVIDDIVMMQRKTSLVWIESGHPRVRLWPATCEALRDPKDRLRPIAPHLDHWDKCYLDLNGKNVLLN